MEGLRRARTFAGVAPVAARLKNVRMDWGSPGGNMTASFVLLMIYRLMALFIAAMMAYVLWRERDWKPQMYAALVFVPFILRGLGVK
jgi:hypothetical protein